MTNSKLKKEAQVIIDEVRNNTGDFNMLAISEKVSTLATKYGMDKSEIARKCQISAPHVYNMLKLAKVPERVKQHIQKDHVPASFVLKQLRKRRPNKVLYELIEKEVQARKENNQSKVQEEKQHAEIAAKQKTFEEMLLAAAKKVGLEIPKTKIHSLSTSAMQLAGAR